jgi:hypothetical protein
MAASSAAGSVGQRNKFGQRNKKAAPIGQVIDAAVTPAER